MKTFNDYLEAIKDAIDLLVYKYNRSLCIQTEIDGKYYSGIIKTVNGKADGYEGIHFAKIHWFDEMVPHREDDIDIVIQSNWNKIMRLNKDDKIHLELSK